MILNTSYSVLKDSSSIANVYYFNSPDGSIILGSGANGYIFKCIISSTSDINDFNNNLQSSSFQVTEEDDVIAKVALEQINITKYDVTNTYTYIGKASPGSTGSQAVWKIKRISFDINGNPVDEKISESNSIWDNRSIINYY